MGGEDGGAESNRRGNPVRSYPWLKSKKSIRTQEKYATCALSSIPGH